MSWRSISIGDLVDAGAADIQTGPFGTQLKASDYVDDGTPVINVRNIGFGSLRQEKLEFVTQETAERLSTHLLEPHDIVFGRKGAVDRHLYVGDDQGRWMQGSDCIRLRFSDTDVVPGFVSYAFLLETHQKWMLTQAGNKATMASLNHDIIRRISLRLPTAAVQRAIINILTAYDDLIENNRRRMALLEEAARQLYREWFVRLRFPGHEHTRIINGVPAGWERASLFEIADPTYGHPFQSPLFTEDGEGLPVVRIRDVLAGESKTFTLEDAPPDRRLRNGDMLIGMDGDFHMGLWAGGDAWLNQRVVRIKSKGRVDEYLLFHLLRDPIHALNETITGTTVVHLGAKELKAVELLLPPHALLSLANEQFAPLGRQIVRLKLQNRQLRAGRDLLLPRLMNGEIAV